jgi:hypothetical protein
MLIAIRNKGLDSMILHFVGSYILGFLPMLGGLVWTIVRLTQTTSRARWGAPEFITRPNPAIGRR